MKKEALLLIDIQDIYFKEGPYLLIHPEETANNCKVVLDYFRNNNLEVIYVEHAFPIYRDINSIVKPLDNEKIIHKTKPSSFYKTDLLEYLQSNDITKLTVVGMMSHMCIDTTVRACQSYGIDVTLIEDCCTTKDLKLNDVIIPAEVVHTTFMASLNGMFAEVITLNDFKERRG